MAGDWIKDYCAAITVCDTKGIILEMNEKACKQFEDSGGQELVGKNVFDCHPGPARAKLQNMINNQVTNCYTTEKNGVKKLVYQAPWYKNGVYKGFVEMIFEIPFNMPHFVR